MEFNQYIEIANYDFKYLDRDVQKLNMKSCNCRENYGIEVFNKLFEIVEEHKAFGEHNESSYLIFWKR